MEKELLPADARRAVPPAALLSVLSRSSRQGPARPGVSGVPGRLWAGFPGPGPSQANRAANAFYFNLEDFSQNPIFSRFRRGTCTKISAQQLQVPLAPAGCSFSSN